MAEAIAHALVAPPALLILFCLAAAWLAYFRPLPGIVAMLVAASLLYLAAMPAVASYLIAGIEAKIPAGGDLATAQAIVVLGGDIRRGDGAEEPDTLGRISLMRLSFAAAAWHRLHLPVLVSGGRVAGSHQTVAGLMKAALEGSFAVPVAWTESESRTTYENALDTARLLNAAHIGTVVVVTDAWHMPRALWSFARVGLRPLPWPAPRRRVEADRIDDYLPNLGALQDTGFALHELIGAAYYRLHY